MFTINLEDGREAPYKASYDIFFHVQQLKFLEVGKYAICFQKKL